MEIFYCLNLLLASTLLLASLWWSRRLLGLGRLNPVSIAMLCLLPVEFFRLFAGQVFIGNGLYYPPYQFAVLMTNLQQLVYILVLVMFFRTRLAARAAHLLPRFGTYSVRQVRAVSFGMFLLFLAAFLTLTFQTGGLSDWLADIRGSYITKREGNGVYYASAVSFLSASYFLAGVVSRTSLRFTIVSLVYFAAVYLLGSKGFLLQFFVFYLIVIWKQGTVRVDRVLLATMPAAFTLLLINFFSQHDTVDFAIIAEYFDYYPNAAMYYADYFSGAVPLFEGKVLLSSLWEYVPRAAFPDKPFVYGVLHVVELYYPGGAESGNTPAFYGGVPQFADFGVVGVIALAILNPAPYIYGASLHYALKQRAFMQCDVFSGRSLLVCLLLFAPAFGAFLPVGLLALFVVFLLGYSRLVLLFVPSRGNKMLRTVRNA